VSDVLPQGALGVSDASAEDDVLVEDDATEPAVHDATSRPTTAEAVAAHDVLAHADSTAVEPDTAVTVPVAPAEAPRPRPAMSIEQSDPIGAPGMPDAPPTARVRARLARLGQRPAGDPVLEPLFRSVRANHPKAELREVERAYRVAAYHHRNQRRRSGEPYITHPLAVAQVLAELGMTGPTLCAALLHDTVEDTGYSLEELRADFGNEVAALVDGVTKLDKVKYGEATEAETVRKMVVAMARDIRVLVIKLADRLHNMRTMRFMPEHKQQKKARETLEIYAPLAHRLGMNTLKWELEDLAFAILYPKMYEEIVRLVAERAPSREQFMNQVIDQVAGDLREAKIRATVSGRPKHYYSVYQKMIVRGRDFGDIYDLVGIRVLVDDLRDCYAALGSVHSRWTPLPGRFKDYIATPKFNMYQSLHTTVMGPEGNPVELQIRTYDMHRRAEYGIAAHWKYKEGDSRGKVDKARVERARELRAAQMGDAEAEDVARGSMSEMSWLRQLVDWQSETSDPDEFLEFLRFDLGNAEVFAFTPKGDVQALPSGATPVDFAYSVHTEVGHRCVGARVNGKLVPLESALENGDVVEIFTSKAQGAGPSRDWLQFVTSARARNKIRAWFSKERREEAVEHGRDMLTRAARKQSLPLQRIVSSGTLLTVAQDLKFGDVNALYVALGEGHISPAAVVSKLVIAVGHPELAPPEEPEHDASEAQSRRKSVRPKGDPGVVVKGVSDVWVKLAKCCTPVPGDPILGFVTRGNGVSVHRNDCVNVESLRQQDGRLIEVEWAPSANTLFLVQVQVEALDRARLLSDVTRALSDQHVNILSASVTTTRDRIAMSRFTFEMADPTHLGAVLRSVRTVEGVYDVYRVTSAKS
jgi:guanosine-3',5'-bis(diphosphate) 3'-pyrophosphohydrolase